MLDGVEELTANRVGLKTQDYCSDFCPILLFDLQPLICSLKVHSGCGGSLLAHCTT